MLTLLVSLTLASLEDAWSGILASRLRGRASSRLRSASAGESEAACDPWRLGSGSDCPDLAWPPSSREERASNVLLKY